MFYYEFRGGVLCVEWGGEALTANRRAKIKK